MKVKKTVSFKDAVFDVNARTITEITKDGEITHSLDGFLAMLNGVEGVSVAIQMAEDCEDLAEV